MKKSFGGLLWSSFIKIKGAFGLIITIALAIFLWHSLPTQKISIGIVLPIGLFCVILLLTFINAAYESFQISKHILPKVLSGGMPPKYLEEAIALCLIESSELFSYDMVVSFYYIGDDNFEQWIGIGEVINIQENGLIQVILKKTSKEHEKIIRKLKENNSDILKKIIVKPNVPNTYLDFFRGGSNE